MHSLLRHEDAQHDAGHAFAWTDHHEEYLYAQAFRFPWRFETDERWLVVILSHAHDRALFIDGLSKSEDRAVRIAKHHKYRGVILANAYARRMVHRDVIVVARDPVGPLNDAVLRSTMRRCSFMQTRTPAIDVLCAWGSKGLPRQDAIRRIVWESGCRELVGGLSPVNGTPAPILRLSATAPLQPWPAAR